MVRSISRPQTRFFRLGGLLVVLLVAAGLRLWRIDTLPPGFHFDESFEGLDAWRILTDAAYRPLFLTGNFGVPPLNAYANALTFWLFARLGGEAGPVAMRTTAAFFGLLGVMSIFALGTELQRWEKRLSPAFPLLAAAALAVMRWHLHFSRMGIEPVIVPLVWAAATWLFLRGWRLTSLLSLTGSALLLAAGMYTYQAAWIIPLLTAIAALLLLGSRAAPYRPSRRRVAGVLLAGAIALLLVLPLLLFFLRHRDLLLLRPAQLVVVGETGSPADRSLWRTGWETIKMFWPLGLTGDLDPRRNLPGAPALDLWLAAPFLFGTGLMLRRMRQPAGWIVLLGWIGLLLPGMVSEYAPHFHRVLGAAAPTALLIGAGLDGVWQWAPLRRLRLHWLVCLLLVAGALTTVRDYFVRWAALPDLYYAFDVGFWEIGQWSAARAVDTPLYISPRGADHPTLAFAWRTRPSDAWPVSYDGRHLFPLTAAPSPRVEEYISIEHEDFRTRLLLPELFPDAVPVRDFLDHTGALYARVYQRPAAAVPHRPPQFPHPATLGDGINLAGYDLLPATPRAGEVLYVQLHWLVTQRPRGQWTVFTHLVDQTGAVVAGRDGPPGAGSLPTTRWQAGWRVLDEYQIEVPADLLPGEYILRTGLYDAAGAHLPEEDAGLQLGVVHVE